jgi:putative oxidoreductase
MNDNPLPSVPGRPLPNRLFAPETNPACFDFALLILRLWLGLTMLLNHGVGKLANFSEVKSKFPGLFGLSPEVSLGLAVFAEVFCSALLVAGLITRFAALNLVVTMAVAFCVAHGMALSGEKSGELAFIYLAGFITLLLAGPGRFSVDACLFARKPQSPISAAAAATQ